MFKPVEYDYEYLIHSVGEYEVERLACDHKKDGKFFISQSKNGMAQCNLCGKKFRILVDGDKEKIEQVIQNACDSVDDIVQTIKLIGDEKVNQELYQFEFMLRKLLGLYMKANGEFEARLNKYKDDSDFQMMLLTNTKEENNRGKRDK